MKEGSSQPLLNELLVRLRDSRTLRERSMQKLRGLVDESNRTGNNASWPEQDLEAAEIRKTLDTEVTIQNELSKRGHNPTSFGFSKYE